MFLLVLAHPGSPGQRAIKWLLLLLLSRQSVVRYAALSGHVRFCKSCPFACGYGPHLIYGSLGPREFKSQVASRLVQPFYTRHGSIAILYNAPPFSHTITPSHTGFGPHLTHDSLDPLEPKTQRASRLVQSFLHR